MRIILLLFITLATNPAIAKENCKKLASATFFQGVIAPSLDQLGGGIEKWQFLYGLSVDEYKRSRVSETRQKEIAKEIIGTKLTSNSDVNSFLISDFYYAHCSVSPERRKYENINELALSALISCWNDPASKNEKKRRKCFIEKMTKP